MAPRHTASNPAASKAFAVLWMIIASAGRTRVGPGNKPSHEKDYHATQRKGGAHKEQSQLETACVRAQKSDHVGPQTASQVPHRVNQGDAGGSRRTGKGP